MKWDVDNHTSSGSLTHLAGNLNNKPAAWNDHIAQPETRSALSRFALKALALAREPPSDSCLACHVCLQVAQTLLASESSYHLSGLMTS